VRPAALLPACLAIAASACQHPAGNEQATTTAVETPVLAQAVCGDCHAVERYGASPNPNAPPFAAIVNQPGLSPETLAAWLRDAHNYPEEMEFYLDGPEVDRLVEHMLTLRDPNYDPAI
jgi:mono/diheme cytochrome c family protein